MIFITLFLERKMDAIFSRCVPPFNRFALRSVVECRLSLIRSGRPIRRRTKNRRDNVSSWKFATSCVLCVIQCVANPERIDDTRSRNAVDRCGYPCAAIVITTKRRNRYRNRIDASRWRER